MIDAIFDLAVVDPEREPGILHRHVEAVLVVVGARGCATLAGFRDGRKVDHGDPAPAFRLPKEGYGRDVIDGLGAIHFEVDPLRRVDLHLLHLDDVIGQRGLVVLPDLFEARVEEAGVLFELVDADDEWARLSVRGWIEPTRREEGQRKRLRGALLGGLRWDDRRRTADKGGGDERGETTAQPHGDSARQTNSFVSLNPT